MKMSRGSLGGEVIEWFGTDGSRAAVGEGLITPEGAFAAGLAVGSAAVEDGRSLVPVGGDTRQSSVWLQNALAAGVTTAGADVVRLGVMPTPGVAYVTGHKTMAAAGYGIVATASHNPYTDNGIKVLAGDGGKLTEKAQADINGRIYNTLPTGDVVGRQHDGSQWGRRYEDFLVAHADDSSGRQARFDGLHLVVDAANGAASGLAERVLTRLGATVIPTGDRPDGRNINEECGATHPEHAASLVEETGADMAVILDGDADRLQMIDGQGRLLHGDHLKYILATTDGAEHTGVVGTIMSNMGFEKALAARGITLDRRDVGDRFVLQGLRETGWKIGGEQSGHIILPDRLCTGDGMLAAIRVITQAQESGRSLEEFYDEMPLFPQRIENVMVGDNSVANSLAARQFVAESNEALGGRGRLNVRASGTERRKVRVMAEAQDQDLVDRILPVTIARLSLIFAETEALAFAKQ
jgi:phosphoglucosamine mutase